MELAGSTNLQLNSTNMTPLQIRALRQKLKLSPTNFGVKIGYAEQSAGISVWKLETASESR